MKKRYSWKPGRHPAASAQKVGEWLQSLPDRRPSTIVEHAKSARSPVHAYFWKMNDRALAAEHRLLLARLMLASLSIDVVVYVRKEPQTIQAQAIMHSSRGGDYDYVEAAMSDPPKRQFILAQALAELTATKRRYAHLSELAVIFSAVDRVTKRFGKRA